MGGVVPGFVFRRMRAGDISAAGFQGGQCAEVGFGFGELPFADGDHAAGGVVGADGSGEDAVGFFHVHARVPAMGAEALFKAAFIDRERLAGAAIAEPDLT
ncbi:hypothetical protein Plav_1857 [Parvibaculum lavamentivorans DS-1]|uniref:Uncharacterized protein n=1 Tax=Parvibaculum lavamentivorans (strain DS-1 / DSM 13023 / NCIMB 13966) TaxID=402881 RepID=A7HU91_PARL1|nr:hypothetical protein Plav_1857 [Parvibaculum lavamentivorans DS-1]